MAEDVPGNLLNYTWNFTVLALYDIPLHIGWNLISLPFEQVDDSVESVLLSIYGKYETVKYYDTLDYMDPWKTYRPGGTANDLTQITHRMGVWVKATEQCNLTVRGNITGSTAITLYAGWNLVGYPSMAGETVANALWGTEADRVEVYQPETPYIRVAESTYVMKPGEGFWVRVTADTVWIIDW